MTKIEAQACRMIVVLHVKGEAVILTIIDGAEVSLLPVVRKVCLSVRHPERLAHESIREGLGIEIFLESGVYWCCVGIHDHLGLELIW